MSNADIHNVIYENINIYCDDGMDKIKLEFNSRSADAPVENVTIENLTVNGKRMDSFDSFKVVDNNLKEIYLDGKKMY